MLAYNLASGVIKHGYFLILFEFQPNEFKGEMSEIWGKGILLFFW